MTKAGPFPHPASTIPVVGLFLLAGLFSDARPALADCPPPPGVTSPVAPSVTAQQVEDGSAALKDFTLAAREQFVMQLETAENLGQVVYYGCLFRQEGSYWHSGSTYLVVMRADGSVLIHAKNMALSSRRLDPLIYAEILSALGVPSTVLANLASPDSEIAAQADAEVVDILSQEPDAAIRCDHPCTRPATWHTGCYRLCRHIFVGLFQRPACDDSRFRAQ